MVISAPSSRHVIDNSVVKSAEFERKKKLQTERVVGSKLSESCDEEV